MRDGPPQTTHVIWGEIEHNSTTSSSEAKEGSGASHEGLGIDIADGKVLKNKLPWEVRRRLEIMTDSSSSGAGSAPPADSVDGVGSGRRVPGRTLGSASSSALEGGASSRDGRFRVPMTVEEFEAMHPDGKQALLEMMMGEEDDEEGDQDQPEEYYRSVGGLKHGTGKCKPCHYFATTTGCVNGQDCHFCHFPHTKKSRPRPCKSKRLQCKKFISVMEDLKTKDPAKFNETMQTVSERSKYVQGMLNKHIQRQGAGDPRQSSSSAAPSSLAPPPGTGGTHKKILVSL